MRRGETWPTFCHVFMRGEKDIRAVEDRKRERWLEEG